jgi:peptidoglycan/LPS O-acetylase OafA/YrhL
MEIKSGRIKSLDGLRAVSITLVIFSHVISRHNLFHTINPRQIFGDTGNLGVRFFFVISGFLITTLLNEEFILTNKISLKKFYIRRTLRIFPAFYFFLFVMWVLTYFNVIDIEVRQFFMAGTYTINYLSALDRTWYVGHLWSLAVEEQFYLLWPLSFWLLGAKRSVWVLLVIIAVIPLIRYFSWFYLPESRPHIKWAFHTVCDSLATGCLLALIRKPLHAGVNYVKWLKSWIPLLLFPAVLLINWYLMGRPRFNYLIAQTLMNISIALLIDYTITSPPLFLDKFLNSYIAVRVGVLSYSLYLWQQFFLIPEPSLVVQTLPAGVLFAVFSAFISYHFVERKALGLKVRFS